LPARSGAHPQPRHRDPCLRRTNAHPLGRPGERQSSSHQPWTPKGDRLDNPSGQHDEAGRQASFRQGQGRAKAWIGLWKATPVVRKVRRGDQEELILFRVPKYVKGPFAPDGTAREAVGVVRRFMSDLGPTVAGGVSDRPTSWLSGVRAWRAPGVAGRLKAGAVAGDVDPRNAPGSGTRPKKSNPAADGYGGRNGQTEPTYVKGSPGLSRLLDPALPARTLCGGPRPGFERARTEFGKSTRPGTPTYAHQHERRGRIRVSRGGEKQNKPGGLLDEETPAGRRRTVQASISRFL